MPISIGDQDTFSDIYMPIVGVHCGITAISSVAACTFYIIARIRPTDENYNRARSWIFFTNANARGLAANVIASPIARFFTNNPYISNSIGFILNMGTTSYTLLEYQSRDLA